MNINNIVSSISFNNEESNAEICFDSTFFENYESNFTQLVQNLNEVNSLDPDKYSDRINEVFYDIFKAYENNEHDFKLSTKLIELANSMLLKLDNKQKVLSLFISMLNSFPLEVPMLSNMIQGCSALKEGGILAYFFNEKFLMKIGIFTDANNKIFKKKLVNEKYVIPKYHMLFENNRGWSELLTLFYLAFQDNQKAYKIDCFYSKHLENIIGKYQLDTLKVLEVILDIFLQQEYTACNSEFIVKLLKNSIFWPEKEANLEHLDQEGGNVIAAKILVSKLIFEQYCQRKCFLIIAILMKVGFVSFASIYNLLTPTDDSIHKYLELRKKELQEEGARVSQASNPLATAAPLSNDDGGDNDTTRSSNLSSDTNNNKKEGSEPVSEETKDENESKLTSVHEKEELGTLVEKSLKVTFLEFLLEYGCYWPSIYLLRKFPFLIEINENLGPLICRMFNYLIDDLYKKCVNGTKFIGLQSNLIKASISDGFIDKLPQFMVSDSISEPIFVSQPPSEYEYFYSEWPDNLTQVNNINDFFRISHELLFTIVPKMNIAEGPTIISKIVSIASYHLNQDGSSGNLDKWFDYTRKFLYPCTCFLDTVSINLIYRILYKFSFELRFQLYHEMMNKLSSDNLFITLEYRKHEKLSKSALKSLSVENEYTQMRKISNLANVDPLAVLNSVVSQIENYDKVASLIVSGSSYFSHYCLDVFQYVLLLRLASRRTTVQSDGINMAMWVQRLTIFISELIKHCPSFDPVNINNYIIKMLVKQDFVSITLLKEIVVRVTGIQNLNDINENQLYMLNASDSLKHSGRSAIHDNRYKQKTPTISYLQSFVRCQPDSISKTIILLYKFLSSLNSKESHYKILSSRYDEIITLLWSFIEMCQYFLSTTEYESNVLSFSRLINERRVPITWAFHIWRDHYSTMGLDKFNEELGKADFDINFVDISRDFYTEFWKYSLYDIHFDEQLYNVEISRLVDFYANKPMEREQEKRLKSYVLNDLQEHKAIFEQRLSQLCVLKNNCFPKNLTTGNIKSLLGYCIIPRVIFSNSDALYSAEFLFALFEKDELFLIYNFWFNSGIFRSLLFSSTVLESGNIGIFVKKSLEKFEIWRKTGKLTNDESKNLYKWHANLIAVVSKLLGESNYMSIRNCIEFLKQIIMVFPILDIQVEELIKHINFQLLSEKREDIILPSNALLGFLRSRLRNPIKLSDFYKLSEDEKEDYQKILKSEEILTEYEKLKSKERSSDFNNISTKRSVPEQSFENSTLTKKRKLDSDTTILPQEKTKNGENDMIAVTTPESEHLSNTSAGIDNNDKASPTAVDTTVTTNKPNMTSIPFNAAQKESIMTAKGSTTGTTPDLGANNSANTTTALNIDENKEETTDNTCFRKNDTNLELDSNIKIAKKDVDSKLNAQDENTTAISRTAITVSNTITSGHVSSSPSPAADNSDVSGNVHESTKRSSLGANTFATNVNKNSNDFQPKNRAYYRDYYAREYDHGSNAAKMIIDLMDDFANFDLVAAFKRLDDVRIFERFYNSCFEKTKNNTDITKFIFSIVWNKVISYENNPETTRLKSEFNNVIFLEFALYFQNDREVLLKELERVNATVYNGEIQKKMSSARKNNETSYSRFDNQGIKRDSDHVSRFAYRNDNRAHTNSRDYKNDYKSNSRSANTSDNSNHNRREYLSEKKDVTSIANYNMKVSSIDTLTGNDDGGNGNDDNDNNSGRSHSQQDANSGYGRSYDANTTSSVSSSSKTSNYRRNIPNQDGKRIAMSNQRKDYRSQQHGGYNRNSVDRNRPSYERTGRSGSYSRR
ncbi:uncharacterized protein SCODWIG_02365 [Saccharomycodes ludwigii]|uniref:THO complex subunit 2 n=1 Tax=Saccharomycodes ludwigii TaxID=36035 RepID=A0A376B7W9_9ASCO|nr:uncharacterized protein SCODWIG_02365 [Saccharomycodes ludwigii]